MPLAEPPACHRRRNLKEIIRKMRYQAGLTERYTVNVKGKNGLGSWISV